MVSEGIFIYKGLQKRGSGEFTNEKGQIIKYNESAILKFDEIDLDENGRQVCNERFVKIKDITEKKELIDKIDSFKLYDKIKFILDLKFTKDGGAVFNLIDVDKPSTK